VRTKLRDSWFRKDFYDLSQDAHNQVTLPGWERRQYDVLNVFIALSIIRPWGGVSRRSHDCRMDWTPDALTCTPRELLEEPLTRPVVDAIRGLEQLPVVQIVESQPQEQQEQKTPAAATAVVKRAPRNHNHREPMPAVVERPARKRKPSLKRSMDENPTALPPPLPPVADLLAKHQRSNVFTSSSDSNASDGAEYASSLFVCDTKAWDDFSHWANGEEASNTLPPLFAGDVMHLEPFKAFTGTQ
jgi:hypothetical protein